MNVREIDFDQLLGAHLKARTPQIPHARYKLDVVKGRIARDLADARSKRPDANEQSESSLIRRLRSWLGNGGSGRYRLAMGVIGMQFAAIAALSFHLFANDALHTDMRSTSSSVQSAAPVQYIRVSFKSGATERDIRQLLNTVQGEIVAGPSQIGEYYVLTPQDAVESHVSVLRASTSVFEAVDLVKKLP
jgi:hypothetical protein